MMLKTFRAVFLICPFVFNAVAQNERAFLTGNSLAEGFDLGVDTDRQQRTWVTRQSSDFKLAYPAGQQWAAVWISYGPTKEPPRPGLDLSGFDTLIIEMRGEVGGTRVDIGIKTNTQPDDGTETKIATTLGPDWGAYRFALAQFTGADTRGLYLVAEFVFAGGQPQTIYVRSVKYVASPRLTPHTQLRACAPEPTNMDIVYGDMVACGIEQVGDSDLFRFPGAAGDKIVVQLARQPGSNADQCFRIAQPDGTLGPYACARTNQFNGVRDVVIAQEITLSRSGTHTIQVADAAGDEILSYSLVLLKLFPFPAGIQPARFGVAIDGDIFPLNDVDLFTFPGSLGDTINIGISRLQGNAAQCARVIEPDGLYGEWTCTVTNRFNGVRSRSIAIDKRIAKQGRHAIEIIAYSSDDTFPYRMEVQCIGTCPHDTTSVGFRVVNSASFRPSVSPGTWVSLTGTGLSASTRTWRASDFQANRLPTVLDDVSVSIDGRPLAIAYISPTQVNALVPPDLVTGPGVMRITSPAGSASTEIVVQEVSPAFFAFDPENRRYIAATHPDGAYVGKVSLYPGANIRPARPGDTIVAYGTGFGRTSSSIPADLVFNGIAWLANVANLRVSIGDIPAEVRFAGVVSNGLYQFNIIVPPLPAGDHVVRASAGVAATDGNVYITVAR